MSNDVDGATRRIAASPSSYFKRSTISLAVSVESHLGAFGQVIPADKSEFLARFPARMFQRGRAGGKWPWAPGRPTTVRRCDAPSC